MAAPFGAASGIIVGTAVGTAAAVALEPAVELPRQKAWKDNPNRVLDAAVMARLVAQGGVTLTVARDDAKREGLDTDKLDALVYLAQTVPDIGLATALWRKGLLSNELYAHVLTKAGLDTRYVGPIEANKVAEIVGLGDIAMGVVRGILPAPPYVPVPPPTSGTTVPRFPEVNIDPEKLAADLGFGPEMLHLMVGRSGLSLAPGLAANALFRGLINDQDALLAAAEGDLRTEWWDTYREVSREILTASQYAELQLRGYFTRDQRLAGTKKHGMSTEDSDNLYNVQGRGMNLHSAFIAERRGGVFEGPTDAIPDWALWQMQRGNLRPEVYNLEWAQRESYPTAFVIRALATGGVITHDEALSLFLGLGWPQWVAEKAAAFYTAPKASGGQTHTQKAQNQLWTAAHRAYLTGELTDPDALDALAAAGVPEAERVPVLELWAHEANVKRAMLTPAQIKKAYAKGAVNATTGVAWTRDEAFDALRERGYTPTEANDYLNLP